jgi:hypothetical protein
MWFIPGFSFPTYNYYQTTSTHQCLSKSGQGILGNEVSTVSKRTRQEQGMLSKSKQVNNLKCEQSKGEEVLTDSEEK